MYRREGRTGRAGLWVIANTRPGDPVALIAGVRGVERADARHVHVKPLDGRLAGKTLTASLDDLKE